jgi:hypothetical protein
MVQGTNFPPVSQEHGVKKIMPFRNQLKINNIKIKEPPFHSGYVISDSGHAKISCR